MLAIDYFDASDWHDVRPRHGIDVPVERVAKEIVHLTYARVRVSPEAKQWDLDTITREIGRYGIRPFVDHVSVGRVQRGFKTRWRLAMAMQPLILEP